MNPLEESGFGRQLTCNRKWELISFEISHVLWQDLIERIGKTAHCHPMQGVSCFMTRKLKMSK